MKWRYLSVALLATIARAQNTPTEGDLIFQNTVGPALHERCAACHGPALQSGNLRLDSRDALLKGGARGPAIIPGAPGNSLLLAAIGQSGKLKMPPGSKLPDNTI